jgi:hypothetical protein
MNPTTLAIIVTAAGAAVNFIWSIFNLRVLAGVEKKIRLELKEYCTRIECEGKHKLCDREFAEINRRLERAGA